jgi:hypothetical protein
MKIAIMQPYIFPYLGYFQLVNATDKFIFYDDVNFIKQGWVNRNQILLDSHPHLYTVPLDGASSFRRINEIHLGKLFDLWRIKFRKKIEAAYRKAPYFDPVYEEIQQIIGRDYTKISELSIASVELISKYVDLKSTFSSSSFENYRNEQLKGEDRVLDICRLENATQYINSIGGTKLYSKKAFSDRGIELFFLDTKPIFYKQFSNSFVANLSIIDVLMFNSREQVSELVSQYQLV